MDGDAFCRERLDGKFFVGSNRRDAACASRTARNRQIQEVLSCLPFSLEQTYRAKENRGEAALLPG